MRSNATKSFRSKSIGRQIFIFASIFIVLSILNASFQLYGFEQAESEMYTAMLVANAVFLVLTILLFYLLKNALKASISKPLQAVNEICYSMATGDLSKMVTVQGCKEVAATCEELNKAIQGLKHVVDNINDQTDILFRASGELKSASEISGISSSQVNTAMEELARGASEQAEQLTQTVNKVEHFTELVHNVTYNIENIAQSAENLSESANEGQQISGEIDASMSELYDSTIDIESSVKRFNETSVEIGKIATEIKDIAEQTTILALNASIEAARAGEHGKGFAVVAHETKKLAERSKISAHTIQNLLQLTAERNAEVSLVLNHNIDKVRDVKQLTANSKEKFENMFETLNANLDQTLQVASYAKEMSNSNRDVTQQITSIAAFGQEIMASTEEVLATSITQTESAATVEKMSVDLIGSAKALRRSITIPIEFAYFGIEKRRDITQAAIDAYTDKHPNIIITNTCNPSASNLYDTLTSKLQQGSGSDIMQYGLINYIHHAEQEYFMELTNNPDIDLSGFDKHTLELCKVNNKLYGLPTGLNAVLLLANRDFMENHSISEDIVWNWDNLLSIGSEIHKQNPEENLVYLQTPQIMQWIKLYLNQHSGKEFVLDDYSLGFDGELAYQALDYFKKTVDSGTLVAMNATPWYEKAFANPALNEYFNFTNAKDKTSYLHSGKVGMQLWGTSDFLAMKTPSFPVDVKLPPLLPNAKKTAIVVNPSLVLTVNKNTSYSKESLKFLSWLLNAEEAINIVTDNRGYPVNKYAKEILTRSNKVHPGVGKAIDLALQHGGKPENVLSNQNEVVSIFYDAMVNTGLGKASPKEAAAEACSLMEKKLKEIKSRKKSSFFSFKWRK